MICRDDILSEIEKELDNLFTGAPETLSAKALKTIKEESINDTKRVLDALTTQELQSAGAYNRFLESTLAQARMRMHMR
jgi:N-acetyl-gamma-glutamylphosphate reductase